MEIASALRGYSFIVTEGGFARAGFKSITFPKMKSETGEYREGFMRSSAFNYNGQTSYTDMELERGQSLDQDFYNWATEVYNPLRAHGVGTGSSRSVVGPETGLLVVPARDIVVLLLDPATYVPVSKRTVYGCVLAEYDPGSLDASDKTALIMNKITLKVHGFTEEPI